MDAIETAKEKMGKTIAVLHRELSSLRAGRPNAQVLDRIMVDYYGTPTPVNQVGNISSPEARMLVITPYDPSVLNPLERPYRSPILASILPTTASAFALYSPN